MTSPILPSQPSVKKENGAGWGAALGTLLGAALHHAFGVGAEVPGADQTAALVALWQYSLELFSLAGAGAGAWIGARLRRAD